MEIRISEDDMPCSMAKEQLLIVGEEVEEVAGSLRDFEPTQQVDLPKVTAVRCKKRSCGDARDGGQVQCGGAGREPWHGRLCKASLRQ